MAKNKKISSKQATANKWAAVIGTLNSNQQNASLGNSPFPPFPNSNPTNQPFTLLPMAMKVAAQTIGMNLVAVKPMGAPTGNLFYTGMSESEYRAEQKRKERKQKMEEIFVEEIKIINEQNETH